MTRRKSTLAWAHKHAGDNTEVAAALSQPFIVKPLATMDEHRAARFFLLFPTQFGKSFAGQIYYMRSRQVEPKSSLWYREAKDEVAAFAAEKFNPLFKSCPPLPRLSFADPHKHKNLGAIFPDGSTLALLSAQTKGNRQSRTACNIFLDEPWLYDKGWVGQISKRRSSPTFQHDWREIYMSTGPTKDSEADQVWMASNQDTWHVRCPDCQKHFFPARTHKDETTGERIGGLIYESAMKADGMPDEGAIAESTQYKCPLCRTLLPNNHATRLAMSGTADNPIGEYRPLNSNPAPMTFGFHVHAVVQKDWAEITKKMVWAQLTRTRAGDLTGIEELVRFYDAGRWDPEIYFRPEKFNTYQHPTPYLMAEPWEGAIKDADGRLMLIAAVDVQLDYFVLVIRVFGKFSQSRLRFAALCLSPSEIALHCAREGVPPERVVFDVRHDTQKIRTICARMGWRTMMGDKAMKDYAHPDGLRRIYDQSKFIDAFTGTVLQAQAGSYVVETLFSKNSALNRLATLRDPDSKAPDGSPLWTSAKDAPEWYTKQINAHYRKRVDNADGSHHNVWMGQKEDHGDDDEAMIVVVASALGLTGAESMEVSEEKKNL